MYKVQQNGSYSSADMQLSQTVMETTDSYQILAQTIMARVHIAFFSGSKVLAGCWEEALVWSEKKKKHCMGFVSMTTTS